MPFFSFIIPVYNAEKYISRCLDSIIKQNDSDFEIIIINDGSKDKSEIIINEYCKKFKNIKYIYQENQGIGPTRNNAIKFVEGKYIWFIDNDDWIVPECLTEIKETIIKYSPDIYNINYVNTPEYPYNIDNNELSVFNTTSSQSIVFKPDAPWSKIYRASFFKESGLQFPHYFGEDTAIVYKLYALASNIIETDKIYYCWYLNPSSFSNLRHTDFHLKTFFKTFDLLFKQADEFPHLKNEFYYLIHRKIGLLREMVTLTHQDNLLNEVNRLNDICSASTYVLFEEMYIRKLNECEQFYKSKILKNRIKKMIKHMLIKLRLWK